MNRSPNDQTSKLRLTAKLAAIALFAAVPALAMAGPALAAPAPGIVQVDNDWQHNQDRDHNRHNNQDRDRQDRDRHDHDRGFNLFDFWDTGSFGR